jgi:hypothetical protein
VSKQRELYWDGKKDESDKKYSANRLTDDRISRLESAGFLWRGANAHSKYSRGREERQYTTSTTTAATVIHETADIQAFIDS